MPAAKIHTYKMIRSLWSAKNIAEQLYKKSPILGMVTKDENFGEEYRYVSVGTGGPQGLGDFDNAKRNKTASTAEEFKIGEASYYGEFSIDGALYRKAKRTGNVGLLKNPITRDSKNLMVGAQNDFSSFVHGNGGGALGRTTTGSDYTTNTVTLTAGADKRRIPRGATLWAAVTDGSSGLQLAGSVKVASVGGTATAPTITVEQTSWVAGIPALSAATQYYLFRAGAFGTGTVFTGLDTWLPAWDTASGGSGTPTALNGVTRANDSREARGPQPRPPWKDAASARHSRRSGVCRHGPGVRQPHLRDEHGRVDEPYVRDDAGERAHPDEVAGREDRRPQLRRRVRRDQHRHRRG
jgi:hypothetical protein